MAHVIEADDGVVDRERRLGRPQDVALRRRQSLEAPGGLVRDVPDRPPGETRKVAAAVAPVCPELVAQEIERIRVVHRPRAGVLEDRRGAVAEHQRRARHHADERIPTHPLATFDALEKEGAAQRPELRERRDRRLEVSEALAHHRHERSRFELLHHGRHLILVSGQIKTLARISGRGLVVPPDLGTPSLADPQPPRSRSAP